ncbi:MAG: agarase [Pseudomonadota bacterium]
MFNGKFVSQFQLAIVCMILVTLSGCDSSSDRSASEQGDADSDYDVLRVLYDFNSSELPEGTELLEATAELVEAPAGGNALAIGFSPDAHWSGIRLVPEKPWDWSNLRDFHFAIDIENTGEKSAQLYVSLASATGKAEDVMGNRAITANRSINVPAGQSGTYFFVLDGPVTKLETAKRENPPHWETDDEMFNWRYGQKNMDLGSVAEIGLNVRGNISAKSLVVDNLRLRRNPEHDLSFLEGIVDEFGQNAKVDFPAKIHSLEELRQAANDELAALAESGLMRDRSRFGGWKDGPKLEATGYFRAQKVDGKWWLVDPDGHLFFSNGLANVRMANLTTFTGVDFRDQSVRYVDPDEVTPEDSIGIVRVPDDVLETRYISSELRHKMFNWLPEYDDELADHYSFRRSAIMGPLDGGETFSFYRANLERRYGETEPESYVRKWEEVTLARMNDWGFTSFGNWVDPAFYPNEKVPYFANGWIIGDFKTLSSEHEVWAPMPDPFDPEFVRRAEITISVIADEIKGSPWCVGVFVDNEKSWGFRDGTVEHRYGVILDALSNNAGESPAKAAFADYLEDTYESISVLNERWNTAFDGWDDVRASVVLPDYTPQAIEDISTLLELLSNEYFTVVHDTLERILPNHLYMGARMANWGMPDETIKAAVEYSDVLSFNIYEEGMQPHAWAFLEEIDLPTIIGEFHIGATRDTGLFHPGLVQADDQKDRAQMYIDYMESVAALDSMVGAHWFQYVDSPITGRAFDGEGYNVGFVTATDIPYPEMVDAAKAFNSSLYPKRFSNGYE